MHLDDLDDDQRAVAVATAGPVVVFAGAGAGKTRAITHRIANAVSTGVHDPRRSLAVTFTKKAAGELRSRLAALGAGQVSTSTFHSAALRQLSHFWPQVIGGEPWGVLASKAKVVAEAASRAGVSTDTAVIRDLAAEIEWAKVRELSPDLFAQAVVDTNRVMPAALLPHVVADVWRAYEDLKQQRATIDFEDVLLLTVGMLADRPDIASQVRERYRWFTVDEFQDVNPVQFRLLQLWLGDRDDVCVVGDPAQTIYTFAGADPRYLQDFTTFWPNATVVKLARTYRCSPEIAAVANRVLAGMRNTLQLSSQQPSGPEPHVIDFDDESAEARGVADFIRGWIADGVSPRDIAILYRTNAQSEPFEAALASADIAYTVRGSERFFERAEIRRAITLLRGHSLAEPDADVVASVRSVVIGLGWAPDMPPAGGSATRELWESYLALVTLAEDVVAGNPESRLADLTRILDERAEQQHAPNIDGVTLASLHAAKGLEWSHVVIAGCTEGTLPLIYAETPDAIAEEQRLFYVGITRAARVLVCTYARARAAGSRGNRTPSRFLQAVHDPSRAMPEGRSSVTFGSSRGERRRTGPAKCRVCGAALTTGKERTLERCEGCPSSMDDALFSRLVEWRKQQAQSRSVPAYVVFTDATLMALAEQRPSSKQELRKISGIGAQKLDLYGDDLLTLLSS